MPGIGWLVVAVLLAIVVTSWVTFTATRMDRLHARVDAAQAALDAQLVRRAAALAHVGDSATDELGPTMATRLSAAAQLALAADGPERETVENDVSKAANELFDQRAKLGESHAKAVREVAEAANKVVIARRFYNDAVRDTRTLRTGRMPRLLRLAGHRDLPQFFDIDDSTAWSMTNRPSGGSP